MESTVITTGDPDDPVTISRTSLSDYFFEYADGTRFLIRDGGRTILAEWSDASTPEDMATYFLGPVLAFVLRSRGVLALHASAVASGGEAIAVVAPPGGGKSTTAAAMAMRGVRVLTDDVMPLVWRDARPWVLPAYPRVRLWPEAVEGLFGSADALPLLTPTWSKRYLALGDDRFQNDPLPLRAIAILDEITGGAPDAERLSGSAAAVKLVANTSQALHLEDQRRGEELAAIAKLLEAVTVYRVRVNRDFARVGELCDVILGL